MLSIHLKRHDLKQHAPTKICSVCLATNINMLDMNECDLKTPYEQLTGLNFCDGHQFPEALCWECAHRMAAFQRYRARARLAHCLLEDLLKVDGFISEANVGKINRQENGLVTRLCTNSTLYSYIGEENDNKINGVETYSDEFLESQQDIEEEEIYVEDVPTENDNKINGVETCSDEFLESQQDIEEEEIYVEDVPTENDNKINEVETYSDEFLESQQDIEEEEIYIEDVPTENDNKINGVETYSDEFLESQQDIEEEEIYVEDVPTENDNKINGVETHSDEFLESQQDIEEEEIYVEDLPTENDYLSDDIKNEEILIGQEEECLLSTLKENEVINSEGNSNISSESKESFEINRKSKKEMIKETKVNNSGDISDKNSVHNLVDSLKKLFKIKEKRVKKLTRKCRPQLNVEDKFDKTIIEVTELSVAEQRNEIEKRKETENYRFSHFKCELCFRGYQDEDAFRLHELKHTEQNGTVECQICKLRYKNKQDLGNHVRQFHLFKFSCKMCPYVSSARGHASKHMEYHKGTTYECQHCEKTFIKHSSYMGHLRKKHPSRIVCTLCGNSFVSQKGLECHRYLKHRFDTDQTKAPEEEHKCGQCGLKFASEEALDTHTRETHPEIKPVGERKKKRKKLFKKTALLKTQLMQCEQCDAQLVGSQAYHVHFQSEHRGKQRTVYLRKEYPTEPGVCEVCGRVFKNRTLLQYHMDTHVEGKRHKCPLCPKTFQMAIRLNKHIRSHASERPSFRCDICDKTYSTQFNMIRHRLGHTEHPECACGKRFTSRAAMLAHHRHLHLGLPWPKRTRPKRPRRADTTKLTDMDVEETSSDT